MNFFEPAQNTFVRRSLIVPIINSSLVPVFFRFFLTLCRFFPFLYLVSFLVFGLRFSNSLSDWGKFISIRVFAPSLADLFFHLAVRPCYHFNENNTSKFCNANIAPIIGSENLNNDCKSKNVIIILPSSCGRGPWLARRCAPRTALRSLSPFALRRKGFWGLLLQTGTWSVHRSA